MPVPFLGSEAVASGRVPKHRLRSAFTTVFPDVYIPRGYEMSLRERATAAWLWSHRTAVIAGQTASALHGARYVDASLPIELISPSRRPPAGIVTHKSRVDPTEVTARGGLALTTVERTAFDIGRCDDVGPAVARLDALGNATGFKAEDVLRMVLARPRGARRSRTLVKALGLYDPGAESPWETWLRLLVIEAGYPRPTTQIPVFSADGRRRYYLDMGWEDRRLAVEYDGDHHRHDPKQFAHDIIRSEDLDELGWKCIRVVKRSGEQDIRRRLARAWDTSVH